MDQNPRSGIGSYSLPLMAGVLNFWQPVVTPTCHPQRSRLGLFEGALRHALWRSESCVLACRADWVPMRTGAARSRNLRGPEDAPATRIARSQGVSAPSERSDISPGAKRRTAGLRQTVPGRDCEWE